MGTLCLWQQTETKIYKKQIQGVQQQMPLKSQRIWISEGNTLKYNSEGYGIKVLIEGVWIKNGMTPALSNLLVNNKRQKSAGKFLRIKQFFIFFFRFSLQITLDLHIRNRMKLRSKFLFRIKWDFLARRLPAVYMVLLLRCDCMMRFIGYDSIKSCWFISYHFQIW